MSDIQDVVIIGSGPAGYTAAIYLGRAGYRPLVIAGAVTPGGQLVNTTTVENFPGFPDGILGPDLMDAMQRQAEQFGARLVWDDVVSVDFGDDVHTVTCDQGDVFQARTVVVTTGSTVRKLQVPGEETFAGRGVSYCATCDGFFFRNKPIVVVGGGDSACEEALFLTRFGSSVTLIHRRDEFRASKIMEERVRSNPDITLMMNTVVDDDGYILVDGASTRTSVPGVFAAGDAVDRVYRQAISAAGMGCRAALDAQRYLSGD